MEWKATDDHLILSWEKVEVVVWRVIPCDGQYPVHSESNEVICYHLEEIINCTISTLHRLPLSLHPPNSFHLAKRWLPCVVDEEGG